MTAEFGGKERLSPSIPLFALEGMNGCGKSHVSKLISEKLRDHSLNPLEGKVSGIGDSARVHCLLKINEQRQTQIESGQATQNILNDKKKDRIFRLAMRYQVIQLARNLSSNKPGYDLGILDRTPMMPWAFSTSCDPNNPFLNEILEDGIETTKILGFKSIYILDVKPETAMARIIARVSVGYKDGDIKERVENLCDMVETPTMIREKVVNDAFALIQTNPNLLPKRFDRYALVPFILMKTEHDKLIEAADILNRRLGIRYTIVNTERKIEEVVSEIYEDILDQLGH